MRGLARMMFGAALLTVALQAEAIDFDAAATGQPPPGWTATHTGSGEATWTVERDATAPSKPNVLKQSGDAGTTTHFRKPARSAYGPRRTV